MLSREWGRIIVHRFIVIIIPPFLLSTSRKSEFLMGYIAGERERLYIYIYIYVIYVYILK